MMGDDGHRHQWRIVIELGEDESESRFAAGKKVAVGAAAAGCCCYYFCRTEIF